MNPQQKTTLIEAAQGLLTRMGHLKRYETDVTALREAIAQATVPIVDPADDRPVYARLMPVPSETFLEKVARLEQEAVALNKPIS